MIFEFGEPNVTKKGDFSYVKKTFTADGIKFLAKYCVTIFDGIKIYSSDNRQITFVPKDIWERDIDKVIKNYLEKSPEFLEEMRNQAEAKKEETSLIDRRYADWKKRRDSLDERLTLVNNIQRLEGKLPDIEPDAPPYNWQELVEDLTWGNYGKDLREKILRAIKKECLNYIAEKKEWIKNTDFVNA